eukprot:Transcript_7875.p3 GENE.Transcript_7875~~Transcript_7875.p3  ORF type:complete len:163 (+),score=70.87 Transcript_7875:994-1482(+)
MIARGAMWNASIFAQEPRLRPQREVFARYVALCRQYDNYFGNCKYVAMQMLEGHGKTETHRRMQKASDLAALEAAASFMATDPAFDAPYRVPQSLEPAPDLLQAAIAHPVNAWRPVPPHLRVQLQKQGVSLPAKRPFEQLSAAPAPAAPAERGAACDAEPGE